MRTLRMRRTTLALAAAALMTAGLTACSAEDISEKVAEEVIENEVGGDADVDIDADGGEVTIEDGDGNTFTSGGDLPDDFPDDIPLIEGDILTAASVDDGSQRGWSVTFVVEGDPESAYEDAAGRLTSAGFEGEVVASTMTGQYITDTYDVVVIAFDNGDGNSTVGYTVGVK